MKARTIKQWAGLVLILATADIHALELGLYEQNSFGGLQGMIDIMVENKDKTLDVHIEGIKQYDLVAVPWGATILLRRDEKLPEEFTVTVTYGNQKIRRKYSAKASHQSSDRYVVKKGESLSNVSEAIRAKTGGTFYQRAIALIIANPGAFSEKNLMMLKDNVTMIIPSPGRVAEISDQDAHAQYRKWIAFGKAIQISRAQKAKLEPAQQELSQPAVANIKEVTAVNAMPFIKKMPVHQKDDDEMAHLKQVDTELGILDRMIARMKELLANTPKQPANIDNEDKP